jgi:FkbM family methyltransferase
MIKKLIKESIGGITRLIAAVPGGAYLYEQLLLTAMSARASVSHGDTVLSFSVPNRLARYRADSFASKEPDTLTWLDTLPEGTTLWDVGANVGLYSIYAAARRDARVYAFEPSVFNLELLARNIYLNGLQDRIVIVPVALSNGIGPSTFKMSSTAWGGALSTFGQDFDQHGQTLRSVFEYQTVGVTMVDAHRLLQIPLPRFLKIDVDGIEHFILRGGAEVLKHVESVLIEINDDFAEQAEESSRLLQEAGLVLHRKCDLNAGNQFNQWWIRPGASTMQET